MSLPQKRLNLPKTSANLGNPFSWYSDNENILVRMLPKNRAALLNEKKIYQQVPLFQMQPAQFLKTGPIKIY
jgi:hypothetical protein